MVGGDAFEPRFKCGNELGGGGAVFKETMLEFTKKVIFVEEGGDMVNEYSFKYPTRCGC
jgi:hypothetical protein